MDFENDQTTVRADCLHVLKVYNIVLVRTSLAYVLFLGKSREHVSLKKHIDQ